MYTNKLNYFLKSPQYDAFTAKYTTALTYENLCQVHAAQTLLAQMERHEMNVTLTLQADAAAFGREASRDMQAAPVEKLLHVLPRKFALNRLADEAVEEEDVVRGKVHAEYMKLLEIEREEERLLLRANMSALELQAGEMKIDAEFYNEDADEEAAQARFWRQLRARESALAGQDASEVRATETVVERERMVGEDLAQTMDPCARERREGKTHILKVLSIMTLCLVNTVGC